MLSLGHLSNPCSKEQTGGWRQCVATRQCMNKKNTSPLTSKALDIVWLLAVVGQVLLHACPNAL